MNYTTPLTHGTSFGRSSSRAAFLLIVALVFGLASFFRAVPPVSAAPLECLPLSGDTQPVIDALGGNGVTNSGAMYFGQYAAGRKVASPWVTPAKPVYYAPNDQVACATKLNGTVYLQGWVWNDNLGWVSLYCPGNGDTNRGIACGGVKYGIQIDPATGAFSGYGWSNGGWIRMNCLPSTGYNDVNYCATSKHAVTLDLPSQTVKIPPFVWMDPMGLNNVNFNAWAWTGGQAVGVQWISFGGLGVPLNQLNDQACAVDPAICLSNETTTNDDIENNDPVVNNGPISDVGVDGEFPVTIWDPFYVSGQPESFNPVSPAQVRNLIYRNVLKWKKVAATSCGSAGSFLLQYTTKDSIFYCKGDVHLKAGAKWTGNKTIIVDGGNIYIEGSLYSDKGQLGLVALRSSLSNKKQGNVYLYPNVRDMRTQIYADGSVYPFVCAPDVNGKCTTLIQNDGSPNIAKEHYKIAQYDSLFGQLYIQGMMIADNNPNMEGDDFANADLKMGEQLRSLGYLRSLPADPSDPEAKNPTTWTDYFDILDECLSNSGTEVKCNSNQGQGEGNMTGNTYTVKFSGYSTYEAEKTQRKSARFADADKESRAVFLSYEPPAGNLPVFEGILSGAFKQIGGQ